MITALDHIAIAVPDFKAAIERFMTDFGLSFDGTDDVPAAQTTTAFSAYPTHLNWFTPWRARVPSPNTWKSAVVAYITCVSAATILMPMSNGYGTRVISS